MGFAALKIERPTLTVIESGQMTRRQRLTARQHDIYLIALTLAMLQLLDGVFTALGVQQYGIYAEGNLVMRFFMESIGYLPTIVLAKLIGLVVIAVLTNMALRVSWLVKALRVMVAFYILAAVLPWSLVFLFKSA